jgi:hypothetical protein
MFLAQAAFSLREKDETALAVSSALETTPHTASLSCAGERPWRDLGVAGPMRSAPRRRHSEKDVSRKGRAHEADDHDAHINHHRGGPYTMNASASVTIMPVHVADLLAELHGLFDRQLRTEVDVIVRHQKVRLGDGSGGQKICGQGQRGSCDE